MTLLLSLLALPTVLSAPLAGSLIVAERSRTLAKVSLVTLGLACCLYATAIPLFGVVGAAAASLTTELVAFGLLWKVTLGGGPAGQKHVRGASTSRDDHGQRDDRPLRGDTSRTR